MPYSKSSTTTPDVCVSLLVTLCELTPAFCKDHDTSRRATLWRSNPLQMFSINLQARVGYLNLERGIATIPLPEIDPVFHSRYR
jgi:hypothetical protein